MESRQPREKALSPVHGKLSKKKKKENPYNCKGVKPAKSLGKEGIPLT